uniref:Putative secreted protein n=1 Tax=Anopheles marajoara TaxID=58244 RepID=A0A2M4CED1_9DIPT
MPPARQKALLATITTAKAMAAQQRTARRVAQRPLPMVGAGRGRKENHPTSRFLRKRTKYYRSVCIRCWKA